MSIANDETANNTTPIVNVDALATVAIVDSSLSSGVVVCSFDVDDVSAAVSVVPTVVLPLV